jgi:hypothetical protein
MGHADCCTESQIDRSDRHKADDSADARPGRPCEQSVNNSLPNTR